MEPARVLGNGVNVNSKPNVNMQSGGQLFVERLPSVDGFPEALWPLMHTDA